MPTYELDAKRRPKPKTYDSSTLGLTLLFVAPGFRLRSGDRGCQEIVKRRSSNPRAANVSGKECIEGLPPARRGASVRVQFVAMMWVLGVLFSANASWASPVVVHYKEGVTHGFLVLSTLDGTPIAEGDLTQLAHGDRVTTRLVYHFKDGSRQEETTEFSQSGTFRLISYHSIQKGPAFKHETEVSITVSTGKVEIKYGDDDGNEKVEHEHMNLPTDLANGLVLTLLKNIPPGSQPTEVSIVLATPKPRLAKLEIQSQGTEPFSIAGSTRQALHYVIKIKLEGAAGVIAPLLGKQPPDAQVWMIGGEAPTFVKSETVSYAGGPMWRTELVSPVWPRAGKGDSKSEQTDEDRKEKRGIREVPGAPASSADRRPAGSESRVNSGHFSDPMQGRKEGSARAPTPIDSLNPPLRRNSSHENGG